MSQKKRKLEQIRLADGCFCSRLAVHPSDWNEAGADQHTHWYINYRFYDPSMKDVGPYYGMRQVIVKTGLNSVGTLGEKRELVTQLIRDEKHELIDKGWNPIRNIYMIEQVEGPADYVVHPSTPLVDALAKAPELKKCSPTTKKICDRS